ncbi:MAG: hypothetical protein NT074_00980, partial [Methanomicrobiales archaeon]|nr:hypothetical protein [Methanomicrobiales archaeon]
TGCERGEPNSRALGVRAVRTPHSSTHLIKPKNFRISLKLSLRSPFVGWNDGRAPQAVVATISPWTGLSTPSGFFFAVQVAIELLAGFRTNMESRHAPQIDDYDLFNLNRSRDQHFQPGCLPDRVGHVPRDF